MEKDLEGFKPCTPCTRVCMESHGDFCQSNVEQLLGAPSFLKMITEKHLPSNSGFVVRILCALEPLFAFLHSSFVNPVLYDEALVWEMVTYAAVRELKLPDC